ncbi:hypothetical protein NEIELOOT_03119 [Neisseria elongata subsp. glycolytica ATCC 29315]|uniref:Uncharacterized protein n=1 Tax=Neisseria elongata subsp. glycolytica ATCC 29315 TaxID=546263 RepID=D4DVK1_NEIEG|nr:hypothetical protein NEIELOOT_03119 [Neisseria elongata subsp. glycolytica ATCC 29315]
MKLPAPAIWLFTLPGGFACPLPFWDNGSDCATYSGLNLNQDKAASRRQYK